MKKMNYEAPVAEMIKVQTSMVLMSSPNPEEIIPDNSGEGM